MEKRQSARQTYEKMDRELSPVALGTVARNLRENALERLTRGDAGFFFDIGGRQGDPGNDD